MEIDKHSILDEVHGLIGNPLFENETWLSDSEKGDALIHSLKRLGILKGTGCHWGPTSLGKELKFELIFVFLGLWEETQVPDVLLKYNLIDKTTHQILSERLEDSSNPETVLRYPVQRAYFQLYMPWTLDDSTHPMVRNC
jgi:hypothetical protein